MSNSQHKSERIQVLSVFLNDQAFGIPIDKIQDVLNSLQLTGVPMAQNHIAGVANLRGRIVTAVNLRKRINEEGTCPDIPMNVVLESGNELYSILVDRVGDVLTLDTSSVEKAPMTLNPAWRDVMHSVHQLDQSIMIILDTDKIIHVN